MQQAQTQTQQINHPIPVSAGNSQNDPILMSATVSILFPFLVAMMISGYRKHRIARFKEQVARLERLWNLSPKR